MSILVFGVFDSAEDPSVICVSIYPRIMDMKARFGSEFRELELQVDAVSDM